MGHPENAEFLAFYGIRDLLTAAEILRIMYIM
jgi:hypothetical protein